MDSNILLLEIGIEEIPANCLLKLSKIILINFKNELKKNYFTYKIIKCFFTFRRIAIQIHLLNVIQNNFQCMIKGPFVKKTKEIFINQQVKSWMKKYNIKENDHLIYKNNYIFFKKKIKRLHIKNLLSDMLINSLKRIVSFSNFMYWEKNIFKFIRPIRNIVFVLGKKNIKKKLLNIHSNNIIQGHRFMCEKKIILKNAKEYENLLFKEGKIIVDFIKRKNIIINNIKNITDNLNAFVKINNFFLEELTSMVEWPVLLIGKFHKKFLVLPSKILEYVMIKYQKYIPLYDKKNNLLPSFIILTNIKTKNSKIIIHSNEKVLTSKFEDIQFFLKNDLKIKFENFLEKLKNIIFQKKLGNLFEKTIRIEMISKYITKKIKNVNYLNCVRASRLSKCDLATQMVYEFPELQGLVGMYYAKYNKEQKDVITALKEQYQYKKNNLIPKNIISCILFISDKIDTLVGIFSIFLIPKGDKDPYALKNITLCMIRIIIKNKLHINLTKLIIFSLSLYKLENNSYKEEIITNIISFIYGRCKNWYISLGYKKNIIISILDKNINNLIKLDLKIKALDMFLKIEKKQSKLLILTDKRINKILLKNNLYINTNDDINFSLLKYKEEFILFNHIRKLSKIINYQIKNNEFYKILLILSELFYPINMFFNKITINHKNNNIKKNRILILSKIKKFLSKITNLNKLY
ncbi:glycine--tRNA ligase subunit beta [Enterobacteriaceae endosymbiont of Donacia cincticornis]|uniref:glycine--tRNA ligase subunit beta n=1 Tax=Enterobacteriaceae endosymbiont of Donacia cincticornis TaxID=2675773 RepID=UPI001449A02B|nr:glycine--tRNA ligase subunit beta [Enterobacteriaceae endosymbiont of Donacia cincticornis]QJC35958.1 glycine--tRNA ligase subunit beta [Enterobacteriaceae endosymbiont of Donacia cincticornis]